MTSKLLHAGLLHHGSAHARKTAFAYGNQTIDYESLAKEVRSGAHWLSSIGCRSGDRVAVALPKNLLAVRTVFSVLASGAIFVPVDRKLPAARIAIILEDSRPKVFITTSELAGQLRSIAMDFSPVIVCLDDVPDWTSLVEDLAPRRTLPKVTTDAPAVFLYTSGTTGKPKAIVLTHENVSSFIDWAIERLGLDGNDVFVGHAPFHFDVSTLDLYAATMLGATVILLDDVIVRFPARIAQLMELHGATVWYSVPMAINLLVKYGALDKRDLESLRLILFAGEPFPLPLLRVAMSAFPARKFVNLYGPTETNVCTYYVVPEEIPTDWVSLPIGKPCEHLDVKVMRESGETVGVNEEGEIVVFGPSVMEGYWNNAELSHASRFKGSVHSYRTGDFATVEPDGSLRLIGRRDDMVKIRGFRVELGEISAIVERLKGVREAQALILETDPPTLVCAVSIEPGTELGLAEVREYCIAELPSHEVPDRIALLKEFPRTSTGKIDRHNLRKLFV